MIELFENCLSWTHGEELQLTAQGWLLTATQPIGALAYRSMRIVDTYESPYLGTVSQTLRYELPDPYGNGDRAVERPIDEGMVGDYLGVFDDWPYEDLSVVSDVVTDTTRTTTLLFSAEHLGTPYTMNHVITRTRFGSYNVEPVRAKMLVDFAAVTDLQEVRRLYGYNALRVWSYNRDQTLKSVSSVLTAAGVANAGTRYSRFDARPLVYPSDAILNDLRYGHIAQETFYVAVGAAENHSGFGYVTLDRDGVVTQETPYGRWCGTLDPVPTPEDLGFRHTHLRTVSLRELVLP